MTRIQCCSWVSIYRDDGTGKAKQLVASTSNPFLAPPLAFTKKEVSGVVIPCEMDESKKLSNEDKKLTAVETFAPIIEAVKSGSLDLDLSEKKPLLTSRPTVHFKIGVDKKSIASSLTAMNPRKDAWPFRDEEKDSIFWHACQVVRQTGYGK